MAMTFTKATPSQHDDAERILRAAFTPYVRRLGRELGADNYAWLAAAVARGDVYLGLEANEIVGVVATKPGMMGWFIDQIGVNPALQRAGVGSWLLTRIEETARTEGARGLSLETAEMMEHLVRLYRRHGFEIVGRGPPAHGKDAHIRVHMAKPF